MDFLNLKLNVPVFVCVEGVIKGEYIKAEDAISEGYYSDIIINMHLTRTDKSITSK